MTILGFAAARSLSELDQLTIERDLLREPVPRGVVTGACVGGDQFIAEWYADNLPDVQQLVIVPANRSRVDARFLARMRLLPQVKILNMPPGSNYLNRNLEIIARSHKLIGYPTYYESHPNSKRSGTWQTIRRGKLAGHPVRVNVLMDSWPKE